MTEAELFVCVDLGGDVAEPRVRLASAVEREWLDPALFEEGLEVAFDPARERVVCHRVRRWNGLELERVEHGAVDPEAAAEVLVEAARADLSRVVDLTSRRFADLASFLGRWEFLREHLPELDLPPAHSGDGGVLADLLPTLAPGCRSFEDLRRAPWLAAVRGLLSHDQSRALEREAPERLQVPSGSHLRLDYTPGRPPVLAARIQELFGWTETPRVARGRVPVLLHLLAPNGRPQQVTDDLASFWQNTYPVVRKELRARYPKHAWPEDPLTARAERRPGRGRR